MRLVTACNQRQRPAAREVGRFFASRETSAFLADLLRLGMIAEPAQRGGVNGPLIALGQLAKRFSVTVLRGQNEFEFGGFGGRFL